MKRTFKDYLLINLKGICMGAADVVPGVSGGTIAFISGIYEELINSIKSCNLDVLKLLLSGKFAGCWKKINGNFLFPLILGIGISLFSLARLIKYLLEHHPIFVWSFFFGLIIASALVVGKKIHRFNWKEILAVFIGIVLAYIFTIITPVETSESYWFLFACGMVAICAMILPGISGAFILLLLGKYTFFINAITELRITPLMIFGSGAIVGLIGFSNILSWLLKKYYTQTIAFLVGLMIGSLNKVWPWKQTISTFVDRHGVEKPLMEKSILPNIYENITQQDAMLSWAILFAILGFFLIFFLEKFALQKSSSTHSHKTKGKKQYGLIGFPLSHSFSKKYFSEKFKTENINAEFLNFEIEKIEDFKTIIKNHPKLKGLSVTIPYKEQIIAYLDEIDTDAKKIGAINSIKLTGSSMPSKKEKNEPKVKVKGYNTDVYGFKHSLLNFLGEKLPPSALILGTGGASKAVAEALSQLKIKSILVSRDAQKGDLTYEQLDGSIIVSHLLVVNTTPLGTFPNVETFPDIPYEFLTQLHFLFDLVYNPAITSFLQKGKKQGAQIKNGMEMLSFQAERSWSIWNNIQDL